MQDTQQGSPNGLVRPLPPGSLDVVGDIHGEREALEALLDQLGYDADGHHPDGRTLVFVGDLCDRGPDSVGVILLVQRLVRAGRAVCILGNHELNILRGDAKDGSGWFFDKRLQADSRYLPFTRPSDAERVQILAFLRGLPLALERDDLRVVHAAWQDAEIAIARQVTDADAHQVYEDYHQQVERALQQDGRYQRYLDTKRQWRAELEDESSPVPFLDAIADYDVANQEGNPIRVLTSGVERRGDKPFFSSHKWRFVDRVAWWDEYTDDVPVIVGHYWRMADTLGRDVVGKGSPYLFAGIDATHWHGARNNVFCIDYSIGGRWRERRTGEAIGSRFKLAAMRWPECELVFDTGERLQTR